MWHVYEAGHQKVIALITEVNINHGQGADQPTA
jgi:hypothetical protein